MRKPSLDPKTFSRRRFVIGGAAAAMLGTTDTRAADWPGDNRCFQPVKKSSRNYEKIAFRIVHVRTDGERVLVKQP